MTLRRIFRAPFEALGVYLGVATVPFLSRSCVVKLANLLGSLSYALSPRTRSISRANLDLAFGDELSAAEKDRIGRGSCCTFALTMLDLLWFSRRTVERVKAHIHYSDKFDEWTTVKPTVVLTAHYGNWEAISLAVSFKGEFYTAIAAPLKNRAADRVVMRTRIATGQGITHQEGSIRQMAATLKKGGRAAMLLDQNVLPGDGGRFVSFMGVPATVSTMAERLALRFNVPVTFLFSRPLPGGDYLVEPGCTIQPAESGAKSMTQAIADEFERVIRLQPEGWLWMYKRWKYISPGQEDAGYPFYARELKDSQKAICEGGT